jgi:hypothetical protein
MRRPEPDRAFTRPSSGGAIVRPMVEHSSDSGHPSVVLIVAGALALVGTGLLLVAEWIWTQTPSTGGPGLSMLYIGGWVLLAWAAIIGIAGVFFLARRLSPRSST